MSHKLITNTRATVNESVLYENRRLMRKINAFLNVLLGLSLILTLLALTVALNLS